MPKSDGGPAFPAPASQFEDETTRYANHEQRGMSLREWYAGVAPAAIDAMVDSWSIGTLSAYLEIEIADFVPAIHFPQALVKMRLRFADAMIEELRKEE